MTKAPPPVLPGQVWIDRDKRIKRSVRVRSVDDMFVHYATAPKGPLVRSRLNRFVRAFRLEGQQ